MTNDNVVIFDVLDSTNDHLKEQYHQYDDGTVIVARMQTKGRGRFDRTWVSHLDLTFSFLFKKHQFPHAILAPVAIIQALETMGVSAMIKWPNDILVNKKKLCGILIESIYEGNRWVADVVGIGINLHKQHNQDFASIGLFDVCDAISIKSNQKFLRPNHSHSEDVIGGSLRSQIMQQYHNLLQVYHDPMVQKQTMQCYRAHSLVLHQMVAYQNQEYLVTKIKEDGGLVLRAGMEVREVYCDEITFTALYDAW